MPGTATSPATAAANGTVPKKDSQQAAAANARWAAEEAALEELTALFSNLSLDEGLDLLARMRKNCEIAAKVLEARRTANTNQRCKTCDKSLQELREEGRPIKDWRMIRPRRDPTTNTIFTEVFCSDVCIALENKITHGIATVSDQGTDATKRNIIAHQEKIQADAKKKKVAKARKQQTRTGDGTRAEA